MEMREKIRRNYLITCVSIRLKNLDVVDSLGAKDNLAQLIQQLIQEVLIRPATMKETETITKELLLNWFQFI